MRLKRFHRAVDLLERIIIIELNDRSIGYIFDSVTIISCHIISHTAEIRNKSVRNTDHSLYNYTDSII